MQPTLSGRSRDSSPTLQAPGRGERTRAGTALFCGFNGASWRVSRASARRRPTDSILGFDLLGYFGQGVVTDATRSRGTRTASRRQGRGTGARENRGKRVKDRPYHQQMGCRTWLGRESALGAIFIDKMAGKEQCIGCYFHQQHSWERRTREISWFPTGGEGSAHLRRRSWSLRLSLRWGVHGSQRELRELRKPAGA